MTGAAVNTSTSKFASQDHLILCIGNSASGAAIGSAASLAGCEPIVTDDWNRAVAQFFVNRRIEAVVLDYRGNEGVGMCLAQTLHMLRRDVPVLLISSKDIDRQPKGVDICVYMKDDADDLVQVLKTVLQLPQESMPA